MKTHPNETKNNKKKTNSNDDTLIFRHYPPPTPHDCFFNPMQCNSKQIITNKLCSKLTNQANLYISHWISQFPTIYKSIRYYTVAFVQFFGAIDFCLVPHATSHTHNCKFHTRFLIIVSHKAILLNWHSPPPPQQQHFSSD